MLSNTSFVEINIEETPFPELHDVLTYWHGRKLGHPLPSWHDVDLMDLPPKIIPRICVIDVENEPLTFKYRFWGSEITKMHKLDFTGHSILDVPPAEYAALLFQQYESVTKSKSPKMFINRFENDQGFRSQYAVVRMPLASNGKNIDHIISAEAYGDEYRQLSDLFDAVARNANI